jgi:hypothetical protein
MLSQEKFDCGLIMHTMISKHIFKIIANHISVIKITILQMCDSANLITTEYRLYGRQNF